MFTELVEPSTETRSGFEAFETTHGSVPPLDPAMVLLDSIIQILVGAMFRASAHFPPDRARITIVTVRRDTRGGDAGHGFGRSEELLRRLHVAGLAQSDVDERTETIDGAIKVTPAAVHLDVRRVNLPAFANPALPPPPKVVDQGWRVLRLPVTDGLVTEFDASDQEHFREIAQTQLVSESPENHERDDVGRVLSAVQDPTAALIELLPPNTASEAPVALDRPLGPFGKLLRVAHDAPHFPLPQPGGLYADGPMSARSILARRMTELLAPNHGVMP